MANQFGEKFYPIDDVIAARKLARAAEKYFEDPAVLARFEQWKKESGNNNEGN